MVSSKGIPVWWWWAAAATLPLTAVLPLIGYWARRGQQGRCAVDGQIIQPLFVVRVIEGNGVQREFCSLHCAELWIKNLDSPPTEILVTEEIDGNQINVDQAFFVRSNVYSNAPTGDRRHVFATFEQAERHAASFRGNVLLGDERPFSDLARPSE